MKQNLHALLAWSRSHGLRVCCAASLMLLGAHALAQNQDAAKALGGLFQNLLKPAQSGNAPAAPQQPANAAGALGTLLGIGNAPPNPGNTTGNAGNAADLVGLLSQSLEEIDQPKEVEIGRQLASILLGAKPLFNSPEAQRYVNRLGRWISLQSARPDLPWTFGVLDDPGFNAFATPGGYVFITRGLLDHVADEAELAAILAHEISHVVGKHHLKAIQKTARTGLLSRVVVSQLRSDLAGGLSAQLIALGRDMYAKGLDQSDELEADRNGVALAARAGLDPYGLVAVLQQLRTEAPDDAMFNLTLSTHPPVNERLDQIEQAMGQRLDSLVNKPPAKISQRLARAGNR